MKRGRRRDESTREVLERATRVPRPDTEPLLARVPALLFEARRRAALARDESVFAAVVPLATRALPRLAAVAVLCVALAVGLSFFASSDGVPAPADLESLILAGNEAEVGDDILVEAILELGHE